MWPLNRKPKEKAEKNVEVDYKFIQGLEKRIESLEKEMKQMMCNHPPEEALSNTESDKEKDGLFWHSLLQFNIEMDRTSHVCGKCEKVIDTPWREAKKKKYAALRDKYAELAGDGVEAEE